MGKLRSLSLSCKQASFFLAFPIKLCTLVYFVSKDSLLDRKSHNKYQCTNLIGLAPWEKAYMRNRPFSSYNGSGWEELRPLVNPWTWPIKQGIEPSKCEIGFSNLMSKLPHHAPGVSVARSLALLALSKLDQWDPVRREVYRQLAETCIAATTSGWIAPIGYLATTPPPLEQGLEECSLSYLPPVKKGRRKKATK